MSQSLYTSMGGIAAAQTQLNVVSNNIANVNTVGFKESEVNFEDIFSSTLSAGNAPTSETGGTNPIQIGLGVQVGSISKNFSEGTWTATGKTTDMMIEGNGFFAVRAATGEVFLTKAGNFTFDSNGDMVNSQGFNVVGADKLYGTTSSSTNVHIPQKIVTSVTPNSNMSTQLLANLNDCQLTMGRFDIAINGPTANAQAKTLNTLNGATGVSAGTFNIQVNGGAAIPVTIAAPTSTETMNSIIAKINTALTTAGGAAADVTAQMGTGEDYGKLQFVMASGGTATSVALTDGTSNFVSAMQLTSATATNGVYSSKVIDTESKNVVVTLDAATDKTISDVVSTINDAIIAQAPGSGVICSADDTTASVKFSLPPGDTATTLGFAADKTNPSNFVLATQLGSAVVDKTSGTSVYSSKTLDYQVAVGQVTSLTNAVSVSNYTIADDGSISATYSNGDKLTIERNPNDQTFQFKYTTSTGVIIRNNMVGGTGANDVSVDPNVAVPSNFQIQLANVVNPEGLVSAGGNLYQSGPNSGDMTFTVGSAMGLGSIKSGGLEASNVDLSKQFSNMIVAQRAVQANSRVFSATSEIMQTLVSLGQ